MKPRSEELLYFLMWTTDVLLRPTWRRLEQDSFESWAWRNGLGRRLAALERQKLIERHPEPDLGRVVRLTLEGRRHALGGRDPVTRWSRSWDGQWRMVIFDLPAARTDLRKQLWRRLREEHFGYLQQSVWISPDPAVAIRETLEGVKVQADSFLVIEGRPAAGESDGEVVAAAWDFPLINEHYEQHLRTLYRLPGRGLKLVEWARQENALWRAALRIDPLLPSTLLPRGYLGGEALHRRKSVFAELCQQHT